MRCPSAPRSHVVASRGPAVPSRRQQRALVVVGSPVLERPLRFGRRLAATRGVPAFFPEQPVPLQLSPETPRGVEVAGGHVVVLVVD